MSNRWVLAIVLLVVAIGSVVFHFMTPWRSTPIASNWSEIDLTITITFWITGVVDVAIILFLVSSLKTPSGRYSARLAP